MENLEQEFKWDASVRGAFAHFVGAMEKSCGNISYLGTVKIADYYLDNAQRELAKRKVALRIRRSKRKWEATCKSRSQLKKGLATRQERTLPLSRVRTIRQALMQLVARGVWPEVKRKSLQVRFVIRNTRKIYRASYKGCLCELALDNYVTQVGTHQMRRKEIELELKKGSVRDFKKLVKKVSVLSGLNAAKISKVAGAEKWISQKFSLN